MDTFWTKLRICLIKSALKRSEYIVKHKVFYDVGDNFFFQPRIIPEDAKYIRFHNNDHVAANVTFIAHDVIHYCFNGMDPDIKLPRYKRCIEIMDNVFIGSSSCIMPNVKIGPNSIVAAGSIVTKDVPEGTIVGGNPAKVIGSFDDLHKRRIEDFNEIGVKYDDVEYMWHIFEKEHK